MGIRTENLAFKKHSIQLTACLGVTQHYGSSCTSWETTPLFPLGFPVLLNDKGHTTQLLSLTQIELKIF